MSSAHHKFLISTVFLVMGAASFLGPTSVAQAQESVACGIAAPTWTRQEAWVWRQLCLGKTADLDSGSRFGGRGDPAVTKGWSSRRIISSRFLEMILLEEKYSRRLSSDPLNISGAWFREDVDISEAKLPSSLYFSNSRFDRSFDMTNEHIDGNLGFVASAIHGGVSLSGAKIAGSIFLRDKGSFQDVDLTSANIGGDVDASGSTFHKKLSLNDAKVTGWILLGDDGSFQDVDLTVVNVSGTIDASGSTFHKKLSLNGAEVAGSIYLRDKGSFQDVDLTSANIGGDVEAEGSTFYATVNIDNADVADDVILGSNSSFRDVELIGCSIGRTLDLSGSYFDGYVDLSSAKVSNILQLALSGESTHWTDASVLDLRATSVLGIDDDENAWPKHLYLTGFTYELPSGSTTQGGHSLADRDLTWYVHWLKSDQSYSRQPYKQVETTLRSVGRDRDADVIAMKSIDRQYDDRNPMFKVAGGLHRSTVGYGYRPEWIIPWALAFVLVGGIVANWLPKSVTMKISSRFMLSAQHLIPLINFGKTYADADVTSPEVRPWVRRYFYFHSFMGWVLAALLVAALTRITATANG
jgi:uncharacterized protein YjbI with pentapeptide repeats